MVSFCQILSFRLINPELIRLTGSVQTCYNICVAGVLGSEPRTCRYLPRIKGSLRCSSPVNRFINARLFKNLPHFQFEHHCTCRRRATASTGNVRYCSCNPSQNTVRICHKTNFSLHTITDSSITIPLSSSPEFHQHTETVIIHADNKGPDAR